MRTQIGIANKARKAALLARLRELKAEAGCKLCPEREPVALDFHHVDGRKEFSVGQAQAKGASWESVELEVRKCVVVCSNCHRKLHAGLLKLGC